MITVTDMDVQAQTWAREAIEALGRRDPGGARGAVATAIERDESGMLDRLADAVYLAASQLEEDDEIPAATWNQLADAVGPGALQALVEQYR